MCLDVLGTSTLEEEWDELVSVLTGIPAVTGNLVLGTFHGVELVIGLRVLLRRHLISTREVAGFMVSGDDEQGLLPGGVLLYPLDGRIDSLVEVLGLSDIADWVVAVTGPVDGAALNHDREAIPVLAQGIKGARGHGGEINDIVELIRIGCLCLARAGILKGGAYLGDAPVLLVWFDITIGHALEVIVGFEILPVRLAFGKLGVILLVDEAVVGSFKFLVVIVVEGVAGRHHEVKITIQHLLGDVLQLVAIHIVCSPCSRCGFRVGDRGDNASRLALLLGALGHVFFLHAVVRHAGSSAQRTKPTASRQWERWAR